MTEDLDNNLDAYDFTRTTMDVPSIEETDPERIELILKKQKTMSKVYAHIDTVTHDNQKRTRFHLKIEFPEKTIIYNRLPDKQWFYLFTQTQTVLIVVKKEGRIRVIATCPNIDVDTLLGKKIEFRV